ncbi:MAG: hypothetical protein V4638_08065 [Bacteroidota bacterium]
MKALPLFFLILTLFGCKTKKNAEIRSTGDGSKLVATIGSAKEFNELDSAPFEVQSAKIVDNSLFLTIQFSGGCQEHDFQLIGSPAISKSLPPIRSMQLYHNSNNDACRGVLTKELEFDISALAYKQEDSSVIYLTMDGIEDRLTYTFTSSK